MDFRQFGPADGPALVCLFGWGNRLDHENVNWLIDQFAEAGYRVHAAELPLDIEEFYGEYLLPVEEYVADLDSFRLVSHSTGGLIAPYVTGAETETYLSPWWGFREDAFTPTSWAMDLLAKFPISRRIFPKSRWTGEHLGGLATAQQLEDSPQTVSPTFIREARRAQRDRPPIPEDAVVFCSLTDPVVSVRAIGDGAPAQRIVIYDGGHELFSSPSRDEHLETLLAVIENGADAL